MKQFLLSALCILLLTTACSNPAAAPTSAPTAASNPGGGANNGANNAGNGTVKIISPNDGQIVSNPITFQIQVNNLTLIPSATPSAASQGHLHLLIDADPPPAGQQVPKDATHIHIGNGASEYSVTDLPAGKHKIIALFADSQHVVTNPPVMDTITITVQ